MNEKDIVIVFDCGATNVRATAINSKGEILAGDSRINSPSPDPYYPSYRIWDVREIWNKMCQASERVTGNINPENIIGCLLYTSPSPRDS